MSDLLRQQQLAFAAAVTHGAPVDQLLAGSPDGGPPLISAYRHAYGARLNEALRDNFEILARAMGDEAFDALATAYRRAWPSTVPSIRWFGHRLAEFMVAQVEQDSGLVPHPAFVDLARMDWALRSAFDAADAPVIVRDALAALAPEQFAALRFTPHPSVQLLPLDWAIEAAWRALREHDADSGDEPDLPEPRAEAHQLLVWRRGLETRWRSLDPHEAVLLQAMQRGENFAALCEHAAASSGDADQAVTIAATALTQWLEDELLSALT
ncbi:DNA-binding domain-containing protein [Aquabacterium sp.]|uniref:DNA-binding domain-containing protein n=1 Tax=Aquabacterium sp. TaxID=1872578 RepID=UPI002B962FA3|nr:DNA-binding domain-containing protein [Aquabacterium sp.]HSW07094.1 DNA-binding domain-containing protein [Aquabacterium sp.]